MSLKIAIGPDKVRVSFSDEPADKIATYEIVADSDLEGAPVGFEAFDFKSPPFGKETRLETAQLRASFTPEDNALAVWFKTDPRSSDQETLQARFGFSKKGTLVSAEYDYQRGAAARKHNEARRG